jgi:GT2 family glycosyltransferase
MLEYGEMSPNLYISGCMMILRRRVFDKVIFNENLMNHQRDDVDFCHRALDAGFKFACFTDAVATHHLEPSGRSQSDPAAGIGGFPEAIFRFRKKDYAGALAILVKLGDTPETLYHGALCLKNLDQAGKAVELFNKTVALADNGEMKQRRLYYSALFHLGTLAESRGDMNCAEEYYAKALSGFPEHKEAAIGLERARRSLLG